MTLLQYRSYYDFFPPFFFLWLLNSECLKQTIVIWLMSLKISLMKHQTLFFRYEVSRNNNVKCCINMVMYWISLKQLLQNKRKQCGLSNVIFWTIFFSSYLDSLSWSPEGIYGFLVRIACTVFHTCPWHLLRTSEQELLTMLSPFRLYWR